MFSISILFLFLILFGVIATLKFIDMRLTRMLKEDKRRRNRDKVLPLKDDKPFLYRARGSLLTLPERSFFNVLKSIVGDDLDIMCKVRLEDLIEAEQQGGWLETEKLRNRIKSRHVDFALVVPDDFEIVCVIELDDFSHNTRQEQDEIKNNIFTSAGVKLLRFPAKLHYSQEEIADKIADIILEKRGQKKVEKKC